MKKKMGPFGVKLLTRGGPAWFNRASLISKGFKVVGTPFRVEGSGISLDMGRGISYEYGLPRLVSVCNLAFVSGEHRRLRQQGPCAPG